MSFTEIPFKEILNIHNIFNNSYFNFISFIIAIIGIILSIYFFQKSKKSKKPMYLSRTINLVKENIHKIETVKITYNDSPISNLSITKIAFWNDGKETINITDIAHNDPIKIKINEDFQILDAEIIYKKKLSNDFNIKINEDFKSIDIKFDYFDFEEGIVLQVYHTGNQSDDLYISGTVKSVKNIIRQNPNLSIPKFFDPFEIIRNNKLISRRLINKIFGWMLIIASVVIFIVLNILENGKEEVIIKKTSTFERILGFVIWLPYLYMGFKILKRRTPKGFDIFDDEF